ncbi:hypothetical protein [Modestobacter roseus]|uniref:(2Fe-2S) ferredoxin n=1 Tax=Modestobacter roseus TaxID=1181884 RepID=A0A562IR33_9ACTN|nr:hypothetical protein [Modestobacter roseus]MQA34698.1 hypothetical protein [Modestobacter roseus]TWH73173.1 hypothetical protein JD78_01696 [Modestobacter roseus]
MTSDRGGPVVAVCTGHRCAGLRRLAGTEDSVPRLAAAVRETSGAVLVTAECVGACDRAAVVGVARRAPDARAAGPALWLAETQSAERTAALVDWVRDDGAGVLPVCLRGAVAGVGAPPRPA